MPNSRLTTSQRREAIASLHRQLDEAQARNRDLEARNREMEIRLAGAEQIALAGHNRLAEMRIALDSVRIERDGVRQTAMQWLAQRQEAAQRLADASDANAHLRETVIPVLRARINEMSDTLRGTEAEAGAALRIAGEYATQLRAVLDLMERPADPRAVRDAEIAALTAERDVARDELRRVRESRMRLARATRAWRKRYYTLD